MSLTPAARLLLGLSMGLALGAAAQAASLGRLTVTSALGQPLRAQIEVTSLDPKEADSLNVRLAPASAFRAAKLDFNPALSSLRIVVAQRSAGGALVQVTSAEPVNEPFLDLLLELTTSSSRVSREYTLLLDPPALKREPGLVAPAARTEPPAATASAGQAPAQSVTKPATKSATNPATKPAATDAPRPAPADAPTASTIEVKRGDTLGGIARNVKPAWISLDQMLVAIVRANPQAFSQGNMNLLRAGSQLRVPSAVETARVDAEQAQREVIAQSQDFARYRSRLVQTAALASPQAEQAAAHGRVSVKVQDKSAATKGDRLQIATAAKDAGSVRVRAADEAVARDRQMKEMRDRIEQLEQTNTKLQRALELQSRIGAQQQNSASGKAPVEAARTPAPGSTPGTAASTAAVTSAPAAATPQVKPAQPALPPAAPSAVAQAPGAQAVPSQGQAVPSQAQPAADQPTSNQPAKDSVAKPAGEGGVSAKKAAKAVAVEPPVQDEGFLSYLWENASVHLMAWFALVVAAVAAIFYRRRSAAEPEDSITALGTEPGFGETGMPESDSVQEEPGALTDGAAASGGDDIAPIAEAEIYLAYGRDDRAEEVLKEALQAHPDQLAIRSKLLELYARRKDKSAFNTLAEDFKERTQGRGDEWHYVAGLGRELDPDSKLFALQAEAMPINPPSVPAEELGPHTGTRDTVRFDRPPLTVPADLDLGARTTSPATVTQFESRQTMDAATLTGTAGSMTIDSAVLLMPTVDLSAMPNLDLDLSLEPNSVSLGERRTEFGPPSESRLAKNKVSAAPVTSDTVPSAAHANSDAAPTLVVESEMATKLDLARGYIDLGVRDGALELLDEVLRGGTPEQRLAANDLMRRLG